MHLSPNLHVYYVHLSPSIVYINHHHHNHHYKTSSSKNLLPHWDEPFHCKSQHSEERPCVGILNCWWWCRVSFVFYNGDNDDLFSMMVTMVIGAGCLLFSTMVTMMICFLWWWQWSLCFLWWWQWWLVQGVLFCFLWWWQWWFVFYMIVTWSHLFSVMVTMVILSKITGEANVRQWKKQRHQEWSYLAQSRQHKEGGGGSLSRPKLIFICDLNPPTSRGWKPTPSPPFSISYCPCSSSLFSSSSSSSSPSPPQQTPSPGVCMFHSVSARRREVLLSRCRPGQKITIMIQMV